MTGASVRLRRANPDDLPAVVALEQALVAEDAVGDPFIDRGWPVAGGAEAIRRVLRASRERDAWECCWVAVVDGVLVGYLEGGRKESPAWRPVAATEVRSVFVQAPFRGRGIGRRLVVAFLQWSEDQQAQAVELGVFFSNTRARAFYARLGFAPTLVTMERVLPRPAPDPPEASPPDRRGT